MTKIKEIFESVQGEGLYLGCKQIFIRFCNCNLKCNYCDTDFASDDKFMEFCPAELAKYLNDNFDLKTIHSIALTGGEPLLSVDFLKEFLPLVSSRIYLETNATLPEKLAEIIDFVDIIASDIKLESSTGIKDTFKFHDKFFEIAKKKENFAKIVFNKNITDEEIKLSCELAKKYGIEIILQPEFSGNSMNMDADFAVNILTKYLKIYPKTRLIPQVHKFLSIR